MNKLAIISGASGMDSLYLGKHLLDLDYKVVGILRRSSESGERSKLLTNHPNYSIVYGDVTDAGSIDRIIQEFKPDECYHLAANSYVGCSWASPVHMLETNSIGTVHMLESLRKYKKDCKFYFAGSSEMFGDHIAASYDMVKNTFPEVSQDEILLSEGSPMIARSPYGVSKIAGYQMTKVYRESYDMFATCGILFNHSERLRGTEFFTRKVTSQLARIYWNLQDKIKLGNLSFKRDEGSSIEYVKCMHSMLQQNKPDDFVIATGIAHYGYEWLDLACQFFNLNKEQIVEIDQSLVRPNEVNVLLGNASKATQKLDWKPNIYWQDLCKRMCEYDYYAQSPKEKMRKKAQELIFS